jgi:hypothetical protein
MGKNGAKEALVEISRQSNGTEFPPFSFLLFLTSVRPSIFFFFFFFCLLQTGADRLCVCVLQLFIHLLRNRPQTKYTDINPLSRRNFLYLYLIRRREKKRKRKRKKILKTKKIPEKKRENIRDKDRMRTFKSYNNVYLESKEKGGGEEVGLKLGDRQLYFFSTSFLRVANNNSDTEHQS